MKRYVLRGAKSVYWIIIDKYGSKRLKIGHHYGEHMDNILAIDYKETISQIPIHQRFANPLRLVQPIIRSGRPSELSLGTSTLVLPPLDIWREAFASGGGLNLVDPPRTQVPVLTLQLSTSLNPIISR